MDSSTIVSTNSLGNALIAFGSSHNEINANPAPGGSANITLGQFISTSTIPAGQPGANFAGATFTLGVHILVPSDAGPNQQAITGNLEGTINEGASGAVMTWREETRVLTFFSPTVGAFRITVEPFTPINTPSDPDANRIRGRVEFIPLTPIPEPATLILLGSGLSLVAIRARRRRGARQ